MLKFYNDPPELQNATKALDSSDAFRVLRRLVLPPAMTTVPNGLYKALYVDVETTGLDQTNDKVIEFGGIPFFYDASGIIHGLGSPIGGFKDPGMPIPEFVTKLTGITDEMVKGQNFDTTPLENELASTGLVIAHNASFDRPMCERMLPAFEAKPWACSMKEVNWKELGADNLALSSLLVWLGYFYEGHRAWVDCLAGIALLAREQEVADGRTGLSMLLESAREDRIVLKAIDTPFETKDPLKERGYKWDAGGSGETKGWFTELAEPDLAEEKLWLSEHIFGGAPAKVFEERQNAKQRYRSP
jgi:DNA polymerase III subunit epsilon